MAYCLPKHLTSKFIEKLKDGSITPEKLSDMSSQQRRDFFTEFLGEHNAREVNILLESKLILKDQQRGIITWAKQTAGLSPKARNDIIARVNKMTEVLTPENEQAFKEDLVAHKLGTAVTMEEAAKISELAANAVNTKESMEAGPRGKVLGPRTDSEMAYGRARIAFGNYINDLKAQAAEMTPKETATWAIRHPGKALTHVAGISKSAKATLDDSALFNQGWKVLMTHPTVWARNSLKSFKDIWDTFGGKNVMDEINADIVSRPNYDNMVKDKLYIGTIEEAFPESKLLRKIPAIGKLHHAAENAFTGFAYRNRADLYDLYTEIAKKSGLEETTGIGLGKLTNSLTSRGSLGKLEPVAGTVNNVFFSPRSVKANVDVLTAHLFSKDMGSANIFTGGKDAFAKRQAAINLVKIISGTAAVLAIAKAVDPESVDFDPRSSDFGKIKVGNTRFSVSGGMGSIVTLAARLRIQSSKSSTTGKVSELNSGKFGALTGEDVVINFFENKLSPAASLVKTLLKGQNFKGDKPTFTGEAVNLFAPLPITNFLELQNDPRAAPLLLATIADMLGILTNTYSKFSNLTDDQLTDRLRKSLNKNGTPKKGKEDEIAAILSERDARTKHNAETK
jgi:hypothetical protein